MTPRFAVAALLGVLAAARPAASDAARGEPPPRGRARATFAGGCFWSLEAAFDKVPGVASTTAGYAGGSEPNPTYTQVAAGATGHARAAGVLPAQRAPVLAVPHGLRPRRAAQAHLGGAEVGVGA